MILLHGGLGTVVIIIGLHGSPGDMVVDIMADMEEAVGAIFILVLADGMEVVVIGHGEVQVAVQI
jgi:hypothetical protein